jgi:ATP-dependent helicase/nuclease subunit A
MRKTQLREEMRLLYVALTRPREKLFVSLGSSDEVKTPENAQNFGDWFRYCIDNSKQNSEIYKFTSAEITEIQEITKPTSKTEKSKYDHNIYSLISKRINTKYDNKCTETPIRVSVSEIKLENNSKEILLKPPKISQKKELSPTEKGTALHTFMRFANLKNAENDINSEILRLVNNQTITEKEGKSICTINFSSFFESNLYKNILNCKNCEFERPFLVDIESLNDPSGLINQKYQESYLAGIIDLILEDEDGLTVVDYKTDFVKNAQELVDRYQTQLILYMEALRVLQDKPVKKAIIYSISLSEEIHLR